MNELYAVKLRPFSSVPSPGKAERIDLEGLCASLPSALCTKAKPLKLKALSNHHRFGIPLSVLALAALGMSWAVFKPELDGNIRLWVLWLVPLLALCLILLWLLFLARYSARVRGGVLLGLTLLSAVFLALFRVEGSISGSGLPQWGWRWAARATASEVRAQAAPSAVQASQQVQQFLGNERTAVLPAPEFHTDWVAHPPRELWRQSIGAGWSAFCVIGSRVVTQEQHGEEEWVSCYDLGTGGLLWHHADKAHFQEWQSGEGPRATPTHEAGILYTLGATGWVNALRLENGSVVWARNVLAETGAKNLTWGLAASPLVVGDLVILCGGDQPGPSLLAYDKASGEPRWKAGQQSASYASPLVARLCGKEVILTQQAKSLTGHEPSTGQILFQHPWGSDKMPKCSQPVVLEKDRVFLSAGYQMGCEMVQVTLSSTGQWATTTLWQNMKMKTQFNSVTLLGQHLYGIDDGAMACMDAATGQRLWKEGRFGSGQHLLLGDVALVQAERGTVHLLKLSPQGLTELASSPMLRGKTWNYPTLAGRHLLVRNDREVAAYELAPVAP